MRGIRAIALLVGLFGLIASSILFWGVFAAEGSLLLSGKGFFLLCGVCTLIAISTFLCLWSAAKQSVTNYLRLLGLPLAILATMQFDGGPAFGLFYFAMSFTATVLFWNLALSGVQRLITIRGRSK
jgi:hypothetical protein